MLPTESPLLSLEMERARLVRSPSAPFPSQTASDAGLSFARLHLSSYAGPTAAAWHAHKYLDPAESGAVLPVLHVNGFKISERTIPGTMDDLELACLYTGYGFQVRIVEYGANLPEDASDLEKEKSINLDMVCAFPWLPSMGMLIN
jgi:hypothetical protein